MRSLRERCFGWVRDSVIGGIVGFISCLALQFLLVGILVYLAPLSVTRTLAWDRAITFATMLGGYFSLFWALPAWQWLTAHKPKAARGWAIALGLALLVQTAFLGALYYVFRDWRE